MSAGFLSICNSPDQKLRLDCIMNYITYTGYMLKYDQIYLIKNERLGGEQYDK